MPGFPTTQLALLARLSDPANHAAWDEFVSIYQPAVYRFARQRGLQQANAQDLAQSAPSTTLEDAGGARVEGIEVCPATRVVNDATTS